jgi:hypothetical protein
MKQHGDPWRLSEEFSAVGKRTLDVGSILTVAFGGPNASPTAKGNRRHDHKRDHNYVQ